MSVKVGGTAGVAEATGANVAVRVLVGVGKAGPRPGASASAMNPRQ
jgi:hypothetical protein